VTDDVHTSTDPGTAPPPADVDPLGASPATPEGPTIGVLREEGTPGLGIITLGGHDAAAGETIEVGRPGANNHSPSMGSCPTDTVQGTRIGIVWIESPVGDTSAIGAVMLQRLSVGAGGKAVDWGALAVAANDNAVQVTDMSGVGAIGSSPTVAELTTGHACVAWIGADGQAHGRIYPPTDADDSDASDHPAYAALNAALDDLGPVGAAPDGGRRLQVAELRPGSFAVMWLALAQGGPILHGSLFLRPAETDRDGQGEGWTQHAIPDVRLPHDFADPFSIAWAEHEAETGPEVTCSGPAGTVAFAVRDLADSAGLTLQTDASAVPVGPSAFAGKTSGAPAATDGSATADLDAHRDGDGASDARIAGAATLSGIVLTAAATPGEDETAPDVATVGDGFAVAWQEPGATDQTRQLKVVLYDAHGVQKGSDIIVADDAAAGDDLAEIAALDDGFVAVYVDIGEGALVVKAYASDGAQIGPEMIVARSDAGAIVETALAANVGDEIAVVYRQQHSSAEGAAAGYGSIMLQQYCIADKGGAAHLVELGGAGEPVATDHGEQPTNWDDAASPFELAAGRAPAVIAVDTAFAIAWVESDGARETVKGEIIDRHGAEVGSIDLSHLLGDAGVAKGAEPILLDVDGHSFLVTWLKPNADGGQVLMTALYRETAPGVWLAPDVAVPLKAFADAPDDYAVSISSGVAGHVIDVIWSEDSSGPQGHDAVYSQRYDLDGHQLGDATRIAQGDAAGGESPREFDSLAAAGLVDGDVVVVGQQGSGSDHDLFAHLVITPTVETDGSGSSDTTDTDGSREFITRVDEETAINPLADALGSGLGISHINGVPISTASPVDVGFGWVQLRDDGWLTVNPDAGYRGQIAFDYAVAGAADGEDLQGHVVVDVGVDAAPAAVTLHNQVTAVAEDVSTASALKVADIAMTDDKLGTDGLALTGLDAGMFEIVGSALYLKEGIELDFDTKPTLSVEILATHADGLDGASFTLNVAGAGAAALAAVNDVLVFAPGYGGAMGYHPLIDLSASQYDTFQDLMDSGALIQEGDNVVITLNPDDPADPQKIVLKGAALSDVDFKFS
jgi:hypothetical protein